MSNTDRDVMGMNLFQTNRQEYAFPPVQPEHNPMGLSPEGEASLLQAIREQQSSQQQGSQQTAPQQTAYAVNNNNNQDVIINNQMDLLREAPTPLEEVDSLFRSFHTRIKLLERQLNTQASFDLH
jgi:small-conductance mechanosensitive channel